MSDQQTKAGYFTVVTAKDGSRHAAWVVNHGTYRTGPRAGQTALKVRPLRYRGATGFSGGAKLQYTQDAPQWVAATMTTGRWKTQQGALNSL